MRHAARIIIAGPTTWATNPGHDARDRLALEDMLAISVGTLLTYEGPGATIGELENRYPIPSEKIIWYDQVNQSTSPSQKQKHPAGARSRPAMWPRTHDKPISM
jgi:hypothetical protein